MRENSGAKSATQNCKHAEERSEHREQNHVACSLISMRSAEQYRREHYAPHHSALCPCGELPLQVAAEHSFFNRSRKAAEQDPARDLHSASGRQLCKDAHIQIRLAT